MQRIAIDARAALTTLIAEKFPHVEVEWRNNKLLVSKEIQRGRRLLRAQSLIEFNRVEDLHAPTVQSTIPGDAPLSAAIVEYSQVLRAKLIEREAQAVIAAQERAAVEAELRGSPERSRKPAQAAKA